MTPNEISNLAAEEVFRTIERTKRINKGEIAEAIEKVLLKNPIGYDPIYGTPTFLMTDEQIKVALYEVAGISNIIRGSD